MKCINMVTWGRTEQGKGTELLDMMTFGFFLSKDASHTIQMDRLNPMLCRELFHSIKSFLFMIIDLNS